MRFKKSLLPLIIVILVLATSCITNKKLTYLQYTEPPEDTTLSVQPDEYRIQSFDNLFIRVVTPDPQWSQMFNTVELATGTGTVSEQSADLISYSVDKEGNIDFPFAGKLKVTGKSLPMVKSELEAMLKAYVTDAAVTVKMINNYVSVMGEVSKPGRYPIYKDRLNIFQALAMAGDLGEFSNRQKIQIIRQIENGSVVKEFSLTDRSILASEFFYVMPNDVIYAEPLKGKFFQMNAFPYGVILSAITTFILLLNVLQN
jgi:polysaccharide biosynthesis/export protein